MNILRKISEKRIQKRIDEFEKSGMMRFFHYDYGKMRGDRISYTLEEKDGVVLLTVQKINIEDISTIQEVYEIPGNVLQRLKYFIKDRRIYMINGYNKNNSMVEGESFVLRADFDNYKLRAEGASMLPTGFDEMNGAILAFFKELITECE